MTTEQQQQQQPQQVITKCGSIGGNVYIRSDEHGWVPACLVSQKQERIKVAIPQYEAEEFIMSDGGKSAVGYQIAEVKLDEYPNRSLLLQNTGKNGVLQEVEDLKDLPFFHESNILYNMKSRHNHGLPYCRIGSLDNNNNNNSMIVAVNPYQWFPHLYDDQVKQQYAKAIVWETTTTEGGDDDPNRILHYDLGPHVYEISALCYRDLTTKQENQSILICGESGSGKTETAKLCMQHLAFLQEGPKKSRNDEQSVIVRRILDSNLLLEAFGNAKTMHNDNSSRFGRYTTLQFRHHHQSPDKEEMPPHSKLVGATSEVFFLEKSRVVNNHHHKDGDERNNFTIFYQLLDAPNEMKEQIWKGLVGKTAESFRYLGGGGGGTSPSKVVEYSPEPYPKFQHVKDCLARLGIVEESYLTLFRAISACLQLGNLDFVPDNESNEERTVIASKQEFTSFCELVGCDEKVMELALTERVYYTTRGDEEYRVPLLQEMAKATADAFAKEIYAKTFLWLARSINKATSCPETKEDGDYGLICILDIFGFESFPGVNGFEQLCINYCDEKLQYKLIKDTLVSASEEYMAEGLSLADIGYDDNNSDDVISLMERPAGLIQQLHEECVRLKGNDSAFVSMGVYGANRTVPSLMEKSTFSSSSQLDFGIHHYAGPVVYSAQDFVDHNRDFLPDDIQRAAESCSANEILSKHFNNTLGAINPIPKSTRPKRQNRLGKDTVIKHLQNQLDDLMSRLENTKSRYVRCINPNTEKRPCAMQHKTTLDQLQTSGVIAAITLSRAANNPSKVE